MNFIITNREIIKNSGAESIREDGGEQAGDNLRFGTYDLQSRRFTLFPEPKNALQTLYAPSGYKPPENYAGSAQFFRVLYKEMSAPVIFKTPFNVEKNDVLFFLHGFNTDLNGVRSNFETLHKKYVEDKNSPIAHIVIFTWPGRHPKIPYHYFDDQQDAKRSGAALARAIEKTHAFMRDYFSDDKHAPCKRRINLMVHSMGHQVLQSAMSNLKIKLELFNELLLMAGDIEYNVFDRDKEFYNLIDLCARCHIYYHNEDRALDISKYTKNFGNRLGRYGRRSVDPTLDGVHDVNVSHTCDDKDSGEAEKIINHFYYYSSREVVTDIIEVLNGQPSRIPQQK